MRARGFDMALCLLGIMDPYGYPTRFVVKVTTLLIRQERDRAGRRSISDLFWRT